ncbi:pancreatic triacylglycerol lipase-like [Orussus abietinus]|uniref:pancreatic triacylglycerol lipase-like n=1 Tax=Orussus abietinus TaxID=222816 RepID=UPI00062604DB|nr:pancreatic triacylglycerol lipase-like [Orussus abietinus]
MKMSLDGLFSYLLLLAAILFGNYGDSQVINSGRRRNDSNYGIDWIFFPDGNGVPQVAILKEEPDTRGIFDSSITFYLFIRGGPENGTAIPINDTAALTASGFSSSRKTKFITHGWKSTVFSNGLLEMKSAYLTYADYNIFMVDWEPLAASSFYLGPVHNTVTVGTDAAMFIEFLAREAGVKIGDVHFIGHSLGAHVAGNAGFILNGTLGRITGLDPASPGFHVLASENRRLDPSDAKFVDIIHTCGAILGFLQPLGHVDFYPNGGVAVQPGCCCTVEVTEACSHGRSYMYYTESINSKTGFPAKKCSSWNAFTKGDCEDNDTALMGAHVSHSASGSYYLRTRSEPPYSLQSDVDTNAIEDSTN